MSAVHWHHNHFSFNSDWFMKKKILIFQSLKNPYIFPLSVYYKRSNMNFKLINQINTKYIDATTRACENTYTRYIPLIKGEISICGISMLSTVGKTQSCKLFCRRSGLSREHNFLAAFKGWNPWRHYISKNEECMT